MGFTEIAKKIKNGDMDAFGILFRNHYPRLLNYCNLFIKEIDIAEDLVQETFISFWERRS
jgi:DNA-directed RNA polymerase specialized sigma24 family protein